MDALQPLISKETLEFHYGKDHQAYVTNLNNLIKGTEFENATRYTAFFPQKSRDSIPWPSWPWICAGRGVMPPTRCGGSSIRCCGSNPQVSCA